MKPEMISHNLCPEKTGADVPLFVLEFAGTDIAGWRGRYRCPACGAEITVYMEPKA